MRQIDLVCVASIVIARELSGAPIGGSGARWAWSARVQTSGAQCLIGAVGFDESLDRAVLVGERG
jgi:hypothetical protein